MNILHARGAHQKEGEGAGAFLLTDKKGNYFCRASEPFSNYCGLFTVHKTADAFTLYKSVARLSIDGTPESITVSNVIERQYGQTKERYLLNDGVLAYTLTNAAGHVVLDMDCRQTDTHEQWGRVYTHHEESHGREKVHIITYIKYTDTSLTSKEYTTYIACIGPTDITWEERWHEVQYGFDASRMADGRAHHFRACSWPAKDGSTFIAECREKDAAIEAVFKAKTSSRISERQKHKQQLSLLETKPLTWRQSDHALAYACALASLDGLVVYGEQTGMYAGLPWFYQFWTRDEAIALGALIQTGSYALAKDILMRQLAVILDNGRIPTRYPASPLGSADGVGWTFFRLHQLLMTLQEKKLLDKHFTLQELVQLKRKLEESLLRLEKTYCTTGLMVSGPKETWMDTDNGQDTREGACIEIQALWTTTHQCQEFFERLLAHSLRKGKNTLEPVQEHARSTAIARHIHDEFFVNGMLADVVAAAKDLTQRPNVFLAYYLCPSLLSHQEWESAFDTALQKLWLEWGGLATIAKDHPLFRSTDTGSENSAYHRGDSWFYVNNLAALCMHRLNKRKYQQYVQRILDASTHEILFCGFVGHHAEISDAASLRSTGCLAQLWSAALYIELIEELRQELYWPRPEV